MISIDNDDKKWIALSARPAQSTHKTECLSYLHTHTYTGTLISNGCMLLATDSQLQPLGGAWGHGLSSQVVQKQERG